MNEKSGAETVDNYDTILRSMNEGLLISINNHDKTSLPTGELQVRQSKDAETDVLLSGFSDEEYKIHRDRRGKLVYSKITENGLEYEDEVITIEILGFR